MQDNDRALHTGDWWKREKVGERERERGSARGSDGLFIYLFLAFKTDGSLCAERKCLLTQLARYWWLPANDNNGIGESVSNSAVCFLQMICEQKDGSLQILLHGHPGLAVTHRTSRQQPRRHRRRRSLAAASVGYSTDRGRELRVQVVEY